MNILDFKDYARVETERVKKELAPKKDGDVRFAFITDFHYKYITEMKTSISNLVHAINELNKSSKIDFVCFGGDNVGNYPNSKEEHIDMMKNLASFVSDFDVPVFFVQGNHDENSIHGKIEGSDSRCRTGFEVPDELQYDILFSAKSNVANYHNGENKALYGYFDIPEANTRIILLNSSDLPYILDGDIMRYNQQFNFGFGGKQLEWLCKEALSNAPENVIFIDHVPFDHVKFAPAPNEGAYNFDALDMITSAFAKGEKIHISSDDTDFGYDITADFGGIKHNIPARISGHCHVDTTSIDKNGLLSITTMIAGRKNSGMGAGDNGIMYEREPYSATESSMDIFTFDSKNYTLSAVRYGSGENRTFDIKK